MKRSFQNLKSWFHRFRREGILNYIIRKQSEKIDSLLAGKMKEFRKVYIFANMERLETIKQNGEFTCHLVRYDKNVVMYDVTIAGEIIGYEVFSYVVIDEHPALMFGNGNVMDRIEAEQYFDKLSLRVEMGKRGICLN